MQKICEYKLNVGRGGSLPVLPPMHDYSVDGISFDGDKVEFVTNDFNEHDYDYSDAVGFKPKKLSIVFRDLCDDTFFVDVTRYYRKKQFHDGHKDDGGHRSNSYELTDFIGFYREYGLRFNYLSVSCNEAILFFSCNASKSKASEAVVKIQCETVVYTFDD